MKDLIALRPVFEAEELLEGIGILGLEGRDPGTAPSIFNRFISTVIGLMTIIAVIWFIFLIIAGAYGIMTAGGDKANMEAARKRITTGIAGLVIVVAAVFIVDLIGKIIGIENILNPAYLLKKIIE